jgi:hypothetical protein
MQTNKLKTMVALLALSACVPLAIAQQGQLPAGGGKQGATAFKEGAGGDKKGAMAFKEGGDKGGDKKGALMVKDGVGGDKKGSLAFKEGAGGDKKGAMAFKEGGDKKGMAGAKQMDAVKGMKP